MSDLAPIAVTGAAGFLGTAILDAAAEAGVSVRAILRPGGSLPGGAREGVEVVDCGLEDPEALKKAIGGCRAVVHAAAKVARAREEERAIENVVSGVIDARVPLVLVSSFSVYAFGKLGDDEPLTEETDLFSSRSEPGRDRYARMKLGQECRALDAEASGRSVTFVRPGVIVGPGRRWTARLGFRKGPVAVLVGGDAAVPLIDVADCGRAVLRAALLDPEPGVRAFNLVGDDTPVQRAYLERIRREAGVGLILPVPAGLVRGLGRVLFPVLGERLPSILRPAAFQARFKPLRYPNDRAKAAGLL